MVESTVAIKGGWWCQVRCDRRGTFTVRCCACGKHMAVTVRTQKTRLEARVRVLRQGKTSDRGKSPCKGPET